MAAHPPLEDFTEHHGATAMTKSASAALQARFANRNTPPRLIIKTVHRNVRRLAICKLDSAS
jgi:hypothetical protein